jgi:hypothetical protein
VSSVGTTSYIKCCWVAYLLLVDVHVPSGQSESFPPSSRATHTWTLTVVYIQDERSNDKSYILLPCYIAMSAVNVVAHSIKSCFQKFKLPTLQRPSFFCLNPNCRKIAHLPAEMTIGFCDTRYNNMPKAYTTSHRATDYMIDLRLMLACQQFDGGQAAASHIGGMLSIVEKIPQYLDKH